MADPSLFSAARAKEATGPGSNRPAVITPGHRVLFDALAYLVAERIADTHHDLALDCLAEALPQVQTTGFRVLDGLAEAADLIINGHHKLLAKHKDAGRDWVTAHLRASAAVQDFAFWRLGHSSEALRGQNGEAHAVG